MRTGKTLHCFYLFVLFVLRTNYVKHSFSLSTFCSVHYKCCWLVHGDGKLSTGMCKYAELPGKVQCFKCRWLETHLDENCTSIQHLGQELHRQPVLAKARGVPVANILACFAGSPGYQRSPRAAWTG